MDMDATMHLINAKQGVTDMSPFIENVYPLDNYTGDRLRHENLCGRLFDRLISAI